MWRRPLSFRRPPISTAWRSPSMAACWSRTPEPTGRAVACRASRGEAGGNQVAAGRCFPVKHFAGGEDARTFAKHEAFVEFAEWNAARGADRFGDGPRSLKP